MVGFDAFPRFVFTLKQEGCWTCFDAETHPVALSDPRNRNHKSLAIANRNVEVRKLFPQKSQ